MLALTTAFVDSMLATYFSITPFLVYSLIWNATVPLALLQETYMDTFESGVAAALENIHSHDTSITLQMEFKIIVHQVVVSFDIVE